MCLLPGFLRTPFFDRTKNPDSGNIFPASSGLWPMPETTPIYLMPGPPVSKWTRKPQHKLFQEAYTNPILNYGQRHMFHQSPSAFLTVASKVVCGSQVGVKARLWLMLQKRCQQGQLLVLGGLERSTHYPNLHLVKGYLNISLESAKNELQRRTFKETRATGPCINKLKISWGDTAAKPSTSLNVGLYQK